MHRNYKEVFRLRLLVIFLVGSLLAVPLVTSYATGSKPSPFCSSFNREVNPVISAFNDSFSKVLQAQTLQTQLLATQWQQTDQNIANSRKQTDKNINDDFTKLGVKATTNIEKQAVNIYETNINELIAMRRSIHDEATATFRASVKSTLDLRQITIDGQSSAFQTAVNDAINTARTSCTSNPTDGPRIHSIFQSSMNTAQTTFRNALIGDKSFTNRINQLITQRNAVFKSADDNFQSAQSSMVKALKNTFGKNSSI